MKFRHAIDLYLEDQRLNGRLSSVGSERAYRDVLVWHGEDAHWRDPRMTTRDDVKVTLRRWQNPNTARTRRSVLVSFYEWLVQEGYRRDNPARATRRPKTRTPHILRLTHSETIGMLRSAHTTREKRAIFLGVCAGLRNQELRGLQGRHFRREGWIHVSGDIGKNGKERWIPVLLDALPIIEEIRASVAEDAYVLPGQKPRVPGSKVLKDYPERMSSSQSLGRLVHRVGKRIGLDVNPHLLRHAYADHVCRFAGAHTAQALLGHADLSTTQGYLGKPTLDELAAAVKGLSFGLGGEAPKHPANPLVARRGFEPLDSSARVPEPKAQVRSLFSGTLGIARPACC